MQFHKVANIYPLLQGVEFESLCNSIKANGLRHPIITLDGAILEVTRIHQDRPQGARGQGGGEHDSQSGGSLANAHFFSRMNEQSSVPA